jgi:hypothetical protein
MSTHGTNATLGSAFSAGYGGDADLAGIDHPMAIIIPNVV